MSTRPVKPLTPGELAEWRKARPNRQIITLPASPRLSEVEDANARVVSEDEVEFERPAPSFIRSGSEAEVFLRLYNRLREGYRRVADTLVGLPNVRSELTSGELDEWIRQKAEASTRRVYSDIKPVRADLAEIVRKDGGPN